MSNRYLKFNIFITYSQIVTLKPTPPQHFSCYLMINPSFPLLRVHKWGSSLISTFSHIHFVSKSLDLPSSFAYNPIASHHSHCYDPDLSQATITSPSESLQGPPNWSPCFCMCPTSYPRPGIMLKLMSDLISFCLKPFGES